MKLLELYCVMNFFSLFKSDKTLNVGFMNKVKQTEDF